MLEIMALFACLTPILNYPSIRKLACIAEAMLAMSGRVTMLGLSRYTSEGGSYRTIQRFFASKFNWPSIRWTFVRNNLISQDDTIVIAGDEVNVTKSGKKLMVLGVFSPLYKGKLCLAFIF